MLQDSVKVTLPPWALPREEITLYVRMKKEIEFSKVVINVPECFEIKDMINVLEYDQRGNFIEVYKIGRPKLTEIDYFGITIASVEPFKELAVQRKIDVKLVDKNGKEHEYQSFARLFRPLLEIDQIPNKISLTDVEDSTIPIHLKFKGFGDIALRIEGTIGGDLVSIGGTSVMDKIFDDFLREGILGQNASPNKLGININKEMMMGVLDHFKTKLKDKEYVDSITKDKEITKDVRDFLLQFDETKQEKYMKILYDTVEGQLIKKLTDLLTRSLSNNVHLDSGTSISTELKAKIADLTLKLFYKDLAGNIYEPLVKTLEIEDNRKIDPELRVSIPIEVEKVDESGKYTNVDKMVISNVV